MATGLFNLKQVNQAISQGAWSGYIAPRWVEYLVVAGGGGAGGSNQNASGTGGGGGGGLLTGIVTVAAGASYTVTVGAGGAGGSGTSGIGQQGVSSVFGNISTTGGGGSQNAFSSGTNINGGSGAGSNNANNFGTGTSGQGNQGGANFGTAPTYGTGGGGGSGTVGLNSGAGFAGNGGAGIASAITGTVVAYAGGGGGGLYSTTVSGGSGGVGGGGTGGANSGGTNGGGNTGGGGGAASGGSGSNVALTGASGGSGIVVVRYPGNVQFYTGGTVTYSNGYIVHNFTANGTLAPTTPTVVSEYQISRSLRFNSADSAYLNRTPSASNRKTWTLSAWVKRAVLSSEQQIFSSQPDANNWTEIYYRGTDNLTFRQYVSSAIVFEVVTNALLRDVSAWYHLVMVLDTTQSTASNRVKLYINGVDQALTFNSGTYPTQNSDLFVNAANAHYIGQRSSSVYPNHYMTEVNFIDGQALTPTSFGYVNPTTGIWSPAKFVGGYGTNGFYLNFSDNSNTTAATLGKDYSGNGNNFTPNNFSVSAGTGNDSFVDTPTLYGTDTGAGGTVRGNYAVINPLQLIANVSVTNGDLYLQSNNNQDQVASAPSTIAVRTGKWYAEYTASAVSGTPQYMFGVARAAWSPIILDGGGYYGRFYVTSGGVPSGYAYHSNSNFYTNGASVGTGATYASGDIIGIAMDLDAGSITFYKNGVSQGTPFTSIPLDVDYVFAGGVFTYSNPTPTNIGAYFANFGQRPFAYTAPSGFKALCTQNLPTPTIGATTATLASQFFAPVIYTGNGATQSITVGFQPDWVWYKSRSSAVYNHGLFDSVRGVTNQLFSNSTAAEATYSGVTAFNSGGFTVGSDAGGNESGGSMVAWNWRASNATAVTNTAGSITSTVSANTTSGFSVVTYTGNGSAATIGHGLGVAPSMYIVKNRTGSADEWVIYHANLTSAAYYLTFTTGAQASNNVVFNSTAPTSTVFSVGTSRSTNTVNFVAYAFAPVAGYSAFGSFVGNGSADGPFIFTGMRPAFVMIKRINTTGEWLMTDATRNPYNAVSSDLYANSTSAEGSGFNFFDYLSNGFKARGTNASWNNSGDTYIYAAFAQNPFKTSLAR